MRSNVPFEVRTVLKLEWAVWTLKFPTKKLHRYPEKAKLQRHPLPHILVVFHVTNKIWLVFKFPAAMMTFELRLIMLRIVRFNKTLTLPGAVYRERTYEF